MVDLNKDAMRKAAEAFLEKPADGQAMNYFRATATPAAVLALIAENAATESRLHEVAVACATAEQERDQLKAESERLRQIISDSATACGAAMSAECTVEFMGHLPAEIAGVLGQLRAELERVRADAERYAWLRERGDACQWMNIIRVDPEDYDSVDAAIDAAMGKGGAENAIQTAETRASAWLEGGGHGSKGTGGHSAENQAETRVNPGYELAGKGGRADG